MDTKQCTVEIGADSTQLDQTIEKAKMLKSLLAEVKESASSLNLNITLSGSKNMHEPESLSNAFDISHDPIVSVALPRGAWASLYAILDGKQPYERQEGLQKTKEAIYRCIKK